MCILRMCPNGGGLAAGRVTRGEGDGGVSHFAYSRRLYARRRGAARRGASGFTLIEILVALAVIAAGTYAIISSFNQTTALAKMNRSERVAMDIAEARLLDLERNPGLYAWPSAASLSGGKAVRTPLKTAPESSPPAAVPGLHPCPAPETLPADRKAADNEKAFYERFAWDTFAKLPQADASYVQVTVIVQWTENGKPRVVSLTSSLPRSVVEGTA